MSPQPLTTTDIAAAADALMAAVYCSPAVRTWNLGAVGNWLMARLADRVGSDRL